MVPLTLVLRLLASDELRLYLTSLPHLIISRTIWSEWTRSRWSPLACCRMSLECIVGTVISRLFSWHCPCNYGIQLLLHWVVGMKQQNCQSILWVSKGHDWAFWKGRKPTAWHLMPHNKHLGKQGCNLLFHNHKIFNPRKSRLVNFHPSVLFMNNCIQFCIATCCQFIICYSSVVICYLASCVIFTFDHSAQLFQIRSVSVHSVSSNY
jgi:hypothetical protein